MKEIIEKLRKEFEATGYASWINSDAYPDGRIYTKEYTEWLEKQIVEALEGMETVGDRSMTNTIKAFDKFRSEYNRSVSNFNIDECIAAFYKKIENYASLDRKRLNEKMLKDLSAKELEDDVNRNKI